MVEEFVKQNHAQLWIQHDYTAGIKRRSLPSFTIEPINIVTLFRRRERRPVAETQAGGHHEETGVHCSCRQPTAAFALTPSAASAQQPAPRSPVRQEWLDRHKEPALEPELPIVDRITTLSARLALHARRLPGRCRYRHIIVATVFVEASSMYRNSGPVECARSVKPNS